MRSLQSWLWGVPSLVFTLTFVERCFSISSVQGLSIV
jgi:hypothetical protein